MLDRLVHRFDFPIGLWSCDQRENLLNLEIVAKLLELIAVELCSVIGYDGVGNTIPTDDILVDELLNPCGRDGCKCFFFNLFSEVVDSHYCVLHTTFSFGKFLAIRSISQTENGHGLAMDKISSG